MEVFISYKDEKDNIISGYFELISENANLIKIQSNKNIITIPTHRLLKMKQVKERNERRLINKK